MDVKELIKYDLQFFGGEEDGNLSDDGDAIDTSDNPDNSGKDGLDATDVQAFADIISEKDKALEDLQKEISKLKKANADMLVKINASQAKPPEDLGKTIIDFCDTRKI